MEDLNGALPLVNIIKNAVRSKHDFTKWTACAAWISRADKRKRSKNLNVAENAFSQTSSGLRIVRRKMGADVMQVCNRRI